MKNFTYESQIQSPRLKVAEYRGQQIVKDIFTALSHANGWMLLPEDYQEKYNSSKEHFEKQRCICDFRVLRKVKIGATRNYIQTILAPPTADI